jgi:hypothetical protein
VKLRSEQPLIDFVCAARRFCVLLEVDPSGRSEWLSNVIAALAGLYAAAHNLPDYGLPEQAVEPPANLDVADEEYAAITTRVRQILGEYCGYRAFFDTTLTNDPAEKPVVGALWDDLADIYRDVKPGLKAWDAGCEEYLHHVAFDWRWPLFEVHWGLHAVNAMRALHHLTFLHGVRETEPSV